MPVTAPLLNKSPVSIIFKGYCIHHEEEHLYFLAFVRLKKGILRCSSKACRTDINALDSDCPFTVHTVQKDLCTCVRSNMVFIGVQVPCCQSIL